MNTQCQIRQTSHGYEGRCVVDTRYGPVTLHATAPTGWIDAALAQVAARRPEMVSGDLWGDIKGALTQAAKSQVARDVATYAAQAARSPLVQSAAKAYSPAAAAALTTFADAADAANALATKVAHGDARAQSEARQIAQAAAAGDPKAQKAAKLLAEGLKAQQAKSRVLYGKIPLAMVQQAQAAHAAQVAQSAPAIPLYPQYLHTNPYGFPEAVQVPFADYRAQMAPNPYTANALDPWGRPIPWV